MSSSFVTHRPPRSVFALAQTHKSVLCLLLFLATLALYHPVFRAPFLNYDDHHYISLNPEVRAGITWHSLLWAVQTSETANWYPVTWLSHELDCQLFGLGPAGPHTVNVFLHALNAVLLFLILASATGTLWRSLAVAVLFALHPMNVESVAWIAERKTVLSMLFFLLALAAYGWYVRQPGTRRYLTVTLLYAFGLVSKPQVITFPFALLLLDYWPLGRMTKTEDSPQTELPVPRRISLRLVLEKVPWFLLSAASAVVTMKVQGGAMNEYLPLRFRLANASVAYIKYLAKTFWPAGLAPMYPHAGTSISILAAALCALCILAVSILVVRWRERGYLFAGWFWFLGTLVPMIGLVQVGVQSMADRYAYLPLLGIFVIVCWGAEELLRWWHLPRLVPAIGCSAVVLSLGFLLYRQVSFWGDNVTLWQHTLDVTQKNFIAEDNVATALLEFGKTDEAIPYFRHAKAIRPGDPISTLNLASYAQRQGNYQGAIEGYEQVLHLTDNPVFVGMAYANEGYIHYSLKQYDLADRDFEAALRQQPGNAPAYIGLGLLAQKSGDLATAIEDYAHALHSQPTALGYLLLAQSLESSGQMERANAARSQALQLTPDIRRDIAMMNQLLAN